MLKLILPALALWLSLPALAQAGSEHAEDAHDHETHAEEAAHGHDDHDHDDHDHDAHGHDEPAHLFELDGLEVLHPWAPASSGDTGLIFMELHNEADSVVTLTGVEASFADRAEFVGFTVAGGSQQAEPLAQLPISPERSMVFEPDVMAIRLTGLSRALEQGHTVEITLITSLGALEIDVMIEAAEARQHSHAGHAH